MPRTLYIHIGMPKTGTTAIQQSLANSRETLLANGLFYPGKHVDHAFLVAGWHAAGGRHIYFRRKEIDENHARDEFNQLIHEIETHASSSDKDILVSSEYLHKVSPKGVKKIMAFAAKCDLTLKVICYVRHPLEATNSNAQQALKTGQNTLAELHAKPAYRSTRMTLRHYLNILGRDALIVRDFAHAKGIGSVYDLLTTINYQGTLEDIENIRTNESLSMEAACIADAHNRRIRNDSSFNLGRGYLFDIKGQPFCLPRYVLEEVMALAKDEMGWLRRNFDIVFAPKELPSADYQYPLTEAEADQRLEALTRNTLSNWYWRILSRVRQR